LIDQYSEESDAVKKVREMLMANRDATIASITAFKDHEDVVKANADAAKDWQNIWKTAGDGIASTFANILVNGGSLFDGLTSLAKQTV